MADGSSLRFSYLCGLRGYHEYHSIWTPSIGEELGAKNESHNVHDRYAIAALKLPGTIQPSVVGHLPLEISRFTYYITYSRRKSVMPSHQRSSSSIITGSRWSRNSYLSNSYYGPGRKQHTGLMKKYDD